MQLKDSKTEMRRQKKNAIKRTIIILLGYTIFFYFYTVF